MSKCICNPTKVHDGDCSTLTKLQSKSQIKRINIQKGRPMEYKLEYSDYCDKIARLILDEQIVKIHIGRPIAMFTDYITEGETPRMAYALTKEALINLGTTNV